MAKILEAVTKALEAVPLTDADQAAAELARTYAAEVDLDPLCLPKIGPALLACLESLGMTPKARKSLLVKEATDAPASPLDELRKRRAARTAS